MLLEVRGEYGLDDKEAKALELHVVKVEQEVELGLGQIEAPGGGRVMVLQHRAVVVQHRLQVHAHTAGRKDGRKGERTCQTKKIKEKRLPSLISSLSGFDILIPS